ncbi:hypothetical protein K438DRAFT_1795603 [Mycena galopus ATCC 62051]|nr:hypothetical protein K438DRAFT_1795603 [Mycena galopus ATCC 62051]
MQLTVALIPLLVLIVGVRAPDNRLLYTMPKKVTAVAFCAAFSRACETGSWMPPPPKNLAYRGFICEPGDFSGKHTDTEARVVCSWYNPSKANSTSVLFTTEVAKKLGATQT